MRLDEIAGAMQQIDAFFGKIDILVNNAGSGFTKFKPLMYRYEFDTTLTLNLKSTFLPM